ncbi:MAG TPA: TAT-variant-translocated molybdopterin oxidoreductase [Tepidisphaeraceae bacterium]
MSQVIKHHVSGVEYWRSLEQLAEAPEVVAQIEKEFPGYTPEHISGTSRRSFMKLMGASMALAGLTLSGCRRWPEERLVPQTSNPEGRIPGLSEIYATVMEMNGVGHGLLAVSYQGRPIKVEGNPLHPMVRVNERHGSADAFAQASVLELYDPDRARGFYVREGNTYRASSVAAFREAAGTMFGGNGAGVLVISETSNSPTVLDMKKRFMSKFPQAKWVEWEPISNDNERVATQMAFGQVLRPLLKLDQADVVFSLDADLLGMHPAHTRYAADWASRRKSADQNRTMNRVYMAESQFSITGAVADARLGIRPSRAKLIITALAERLGVGGIKAAGTLEGNEQKFVEAAAADLKAAGNKAVITAGAHLAPDVQAVSFAINAALGATGNTVVLLPVPDADRPTHADGIKVAADALKSGNVKTLLIIGGNPAYDAPAELDLAKLIGGVTNSVHVSIYRNETSLAAHWNVPKAHYLEAWGDARGYDGTLSVAQPLIEPLFGGVSTIEVLAMLTGDQVTAGHDLVRRTIEPLLGGNDKELAFRRMMHDGVLAESAAKPVQVAAKPSPPPSPAVPGEGGSTLEVRFFADPSVFDGRYANSGWLQETPDPLTKLTWDNAALFSPKDAKALGINGGDMVKITVDGQSLEIAAFVQPGQPVGVIGLPLGYGRGAAGNVGSGLGFNTYKIRTSNTLFAAAGAQVSKLNTRYKLVTTQNDYILNMDHIGREGAEERIGAKHESGSVVRETTLAQYKQNPRAAHPKAHGNLNLQLFDPPSHFNDPHAWGMAVDMSTCIGCNACVVACVSENNIPVVGKPEVAEHRQMHWIRIDRYFKGTAEDPEPEIAFQPMLCVHCENAPCEQVCPVAATVHDSEGLNTMVYNRCIGTRYCSNNCPYKVRRFNYFDWHSLDPRGGRFPKPWLGIPDQQQVESIDAIKQMVFNPDVTVRMRGVMEKCTYCVQRIENVKIKAKNDHLAGKRDSELVQDGEVLTACQQACPTQAITFGNINDKNAWVTQLHQNPRSYSVLEELNTRPRTKFLAKLRNPNEALAEGHGAGEGKAALTPPPSGPGEGKKGTSFEGVNA